jgi:hypothetical protein
VNAEDAWNNPTRQMFLTQLVLCCVAQAEEPQDTPGGRGGGGVYCGYGDMWSMLKTCLLYGNHRLGFGHKGLTPNGG